MTRLWALALAAMVGLPAVAQDASPGDALLARQFRDIDADRDGTASAEEFSAYGDLVMVSMDSDGSGDLDAGEFTSWGFGMHNLVGEAGTAEGYELAVRVVFDYWDRGHDGRLSSADLAEAGAASFAHADASGDGRLDEAEFLDNLLLNIALRSALAPAP